MGDAALVASADIASLFEEVSILGSWQGLSAFYTLNES